MAVRIRTCKPGLFAILLSLAAAPAARSQDGASQSPALAKELQTVMVEKKLDAIAAADPETAGGFIAVLLFPDVQLLAVAAPHPSADYLQYQIAQKNYREVYSVLQQTDVTPRRLFFQDLGADGLRGAGPAVDVMYDRGKQTLLDGRGRDASKALRAADERYARILRIAIAAARGHSDKVP
jgi:hypothetical protein